MSNIRSLNDYSKDDKQNERKTTNYTGGEHSGLSVENNPDDSLNKWPSRVDANPTSPFNVITMYKNGYVLDGGSFQPLLEDDHARFLSDLKAGTKPKELKMANIKSNFIGLENRLSEVYQDTSKPESSLFKGVGNSISSTQPQAPLEGAQSTHVNLTQNPLEVDDSQPFTIINIRFHNGEKHKIRFNQHHTLADLHTFVACVSPLECNYRLVEGFPPKEIPSNQMTLKDAGLLQTSVNQVLV